MTFQRLRNLFVDDPKRGAEYFGQSANAAMIFGEADEAGARAAIAASYAARFLGDVPEPLLVERSKPEIETQSD
jgi:hypothetical protein